MKLVSGMQGMRNQEIAWGDKKEKKKRRKRMNEHKTEEKGTR